MPTLDVALDLAAVVTNDQLVGSLGPVPLEVARARRTTPARPCVFDLAYAADHAQPLPVSGSTMVRRYVQREPERS